jgi:hypothetical protein
MISYATQCDAMHCSALELSRQHLSTQFTFSCSHYLLHSYHADIMSKMTNGNLKVQGPPPSYKGHTVAGKGKASGIEKSSSSEKKNLQSPVRTGSTPGKGEILVPGSPQVTSPHPCPCPPHSICLPHSSFFSSDTNCYTNNAQAQRVVKSKESKVQDPPHKDLLDLKHVREKQRLDFKSFLQYKREGAASVHPTDFDVSDTALLLICPFPILY